MICLQIGRLQRHVAGCSHEGVRGWLVAGVGWVNDHLDFMKAQFTGTQPPPVPLPHLAGLVTAMASAQGGVIPGGLAPPPGGSSGCLMPVLTGGSLPERALFWHYPHYGNQGGAPAAAIRKGNHKLIHWFEEDRIELFDLSSDLSEKSDLALARPDLVDALSGELKTWQEDVGAKFPTPNPNFDPAKPNGRAAGGKPKASPGKGKK